jgi:predicted PurR-regulated permease PerM
MVLCQTTSRLEFGMPPAPSTPVSNASSRFEQFARIAAISLLVLGCFLILQPFLGAILFAGVLCLSTWPAFTRLRDRLGGRDWLAALILVAGMVVALALPIALAAQSLVVHSAEIVETARGFLDRRESMEIPRFIRDIPVLGPAIEEYWKVLMQSRDELVNLGKRLADPAKALLVSLGGAVGQGLVQVLIAIFVAFFLYRDGERVRRLLLELMGRLAGPEHGSALVTTAQNAVKGVVYGLLGTAFAQAAVAVIGFLIAGVPGAFLLGAFTFILSLVPMGPVLIWGGAAAWLYFQDQTGWSIFMIIYGIGVISSVDNFVKPILMSRAGNLSMLLVVLGVFGGAVAFGFIGLFVGPALLAVGWSLTKAWLDGPEPQR